MITTQKELRDAFWNSNTNLVRHGNKKQNDYPVDTRMAWVDFVNALCCNGEISEALANRATL